MSLREFDLIDRYFSGLTHTDSDVKCGIGDDAASLHFPGDRELLVAVDTLVANVHFDESADAGDIGYKSLAVNLSDIAAMGGTPHWATLALTMPETDPDWIQAFANGFADIARQHGIALIGGDTTKGPLSITVQAMGSVEPGLSLLRGGAKSGDLIYVSGCLGAAGFARKLIEDRIASTDIPLHCLQRLHRPEPRVTLGRQLGGLASAAIDISDGLAADLNHLLRASGAGAEVELDCLPVCRELNKTGDRELERQIALASGDDYELCFTIAADQEEELVKRTAQLKTPVSLIGKITGGDGTRWIDEDGREVKLQLQGYQHF